MASLLALGGAFSWGAGDFLGGLASRRIAVVTVLVVSQAAGLAGLLVWVLASGETFPGIAELAPAVAAGVAGIVGLAALYRGFALGAMGIVAPISGAAPLVPLSVDAANGIVPSFVQLVGVACALGGIVALSHERSTAGRLQVTAGATLAVVAALGFGWFIVGIDAGADESAWWAVVAARTTSVALALVGVAITGAAVRPAARLLPMLVAVGVFDTGANVLVAYATTKGAAGIVAVLSALYPVVTVILARLVLAERLGVARRLGGGLALAGAALVAAG
jgi:drug/metabolite transporter (DMT)-like permease